MVRAYSENKMYTKRWYASAALFFGMMLAVCMYISAMPAAAQRIQTQGRGATAHRSDGPHAPSSSTGEAAKAGPKTPGELLMQNKKLSDKLSTILKRQNPPVTDLQAASQGFKILVMFVSAIHVSDNLGIPFDQLQTQKQASGSLSKAIHVLKPDADANAEVKKAAKQVVDDMEESQRRS